MYFWTNQNYSLEFALYFYFKTLSVNDINECSEHNIDWDGDEDKPRQHQEVGPREKLQTGVVDFLKASLYQASAGGGEKSKDWEDSANLLFTWVDIIFSLKYF